MKISTRQDMVFAASAIISGNISPDDLEFSDYITDSIKIFSDNFENANILDYRTAQIINAVQKDIIGIYNIIFCTDVTLKNLDKHEFLIVKFSIEDGCIKFISRIAKKLFDLVFEDSGNPLGNEELFRDMTAKQKIATVLLLLALAGVWKLPDVIRAIRENPEISVLIDGNSKITEGLSKNQETSLVIINNLGDGHVEYNGVPSGKDDYKDNLFKSEKKDIVPVQLDDDFFILQYDFKNQKIFLFQTGQEPFWASTAWLGQEARDRLREITSSAIANQTVARQFVNMACKIKDNKIVGAVVEGVGLPIRPEAKGFIDTMQIKRTQKGTQEQRNLFE
ncbi:MAG: hypothetical protein RBR41_03060 [Desulfovibrio sp.]|uniref:hypothetical protein n=1 Tax=Desulfovibrio sp. TaxID=885 RepID=UPI002A35BA6C|nr:hypothetical protein [Desulfovibrio sp.]MDY0258630.1 hypothetical protein [Desulfovibrio sp.]